MQKHYYYMSNPGAILRRMFPEQLKTQARIIIWTVVFIINMIVIVLIQNYAIYKITDVSKEGLAQTSYFENCVIKEIKKLQTDEMQLDLYSVTYQNESGTEETVYMEEFPVSIFERFRIKTSGEPASSIFWQGNEIKKLAGIYIACGVVMLGIEFFLFSLVGKKNHK